MKAFLVIVLLAFVGWYFNLIPEMSRYKTPVTASTVTASESPSAPSAPVVAAVGGAIAGAAVVGGFGAFLAGGWLLAEGIGFAMMLLLMLPAFLAFVALGALTEWGDPHFNWRKRDKEDYRTESREFATTIVFAATMLFLNWIGVPIWATIMATPWYVSIGCALAYIVMGFFVWALLIRWDDLSAYLHDRRKRFYQSISGGIRVELEHIVTLKKKLTDRRLDQSDRAELQAKLNKQVIHVRKNLLGETLVEREGVSEHSRQHYEDYQLYVAEEFKDGKLEQWISELQPSEGKEFTYPPEFAGVFKEKEEDAPKVLWQDHKGQLFLWSVFWPLSMGTRFVHYVVTLRLFKRLAMLIINRLGAVYDRIAKRHEVTVKAIERDPADTPSSPASGSNVQPLKQAGRDNPNNH